MKIRVDLSGLARKADKSVQRVQKAAVRGINDTAFAVRKETPDFLRKTIDRPTAFSLRPPQIDKADATSMRATIRIGSEQSKYLRFSEFGEEDQKLVVPIFGNGGEDKSGNLSKRFRGELLKQRMNGRVKKYDVVTVKSGKNKGQMRRKKVGELSFSEYFIGKPKNRPGAAAGIYQRGGSNVSLTMIAVFRKKYSYKSKFGIRNFWRKQINATAAKFIGERMRGGSS